MTILGPNTEVASMPKTDGERKDTPGVIAPPPLIFLAFILLGVVLDLVRPMAILPAGPRYLAGAVLIALGLAGVASVFRRFRAAATNVQTREPTTALVTGGLLRFSRNPIYVSMGLAHAGIAVAADGVWILAMLVPALAVIRTGVIPREERYLERRFGDDYRRYMESVRRWL